MNKLKIHVEKIVRPIRASDRSKMKMREELLGHLLAGHKEALSLGKNNPIDAAINQLGNTDRLRDELQASVSHLEQFCALRLKTNLEQSFKPSSKSDFTLALRASMEVVFFCALLLLLPALAVAILGNPSKEVSTYVPIIIIFASMGVAFLISTFAYRALHFPQITHPSSSASCYLKGVIETMNWLVMIGLFLTFIGILDHWIYPLTSDIPFPEVLLIVARQPILIFMPAISFLVTAYAAYVTRKQYMAWDNLEITE
ncbi:MAG: hypothetical protein COA73_07705 [Candidatus Hydrogenedentota bacterium]|nr:MAG: hypothetical protein COA73_07705 [Candidatus Hydrogenedentota bacterium]